MIVFLPRRVSLVEVTRCSGMSPSGSKIPLETGLWWMGRMVTLWAIHVLDCDLHPFFFSFQEKINGFGDPPERTERECLQNMFQLPHF